MRYVSTRGHAPVLDFEGVTLTGLASDGGLYLPEEYPAFGRDEIAAMRGMPYAQLAARVMAPFTAPCVSEDDLLALCETAYGRFDHADVTPLTRIDERHHLLELFHGPTLAFKDVALQLLGLLFERFLKTQERPLTIIGATSGDTGSAAIHAVAGRDNVEIFMLHPEGRVSEIQRRQMTTIDAPNVHNIAIGGSFDDAQRYVKRMFGDAALTDRIAVGAVNSINWARLMAQVVYYFHAALQLGGPDRKVAFSVPTGNFGDVFAGYVAAQMGLPVERLIVATNKNDILARAIRDGDYSVGESHATITPSMDIQVSSNFERLLFEANGRHAAALTAQMQGFGKSGRLALDPGQREGIAAMFAAERATPEETLAALRWAHETCGEVIDPHTAVGLHAARALADTIDPDVPIVTLATAHPAKFPDAVEQAIEAKADLPARVGDLFALDERSETLPADYDTVRDYIAANASGAR
ncbi:threonine synthase [Alteriqipengyuania lutimaris]|uniref:Threonine synthase n=1 Tax=Alteriqipengyuania lutimaris TaxID=1538146 RepID=A0A395LL96_9SPHN|nr:threonine synthase [Alteriqipengyuania lutimaris]MBB3033193.1 threonine synthase [Alteriqipengyuania lutimaris]RDS77758.1 threonine synthase [Alteriqipengyuania lutimaris]